MKGRAGYPLLVTNYEKQSKIHQVSFIEGKCSKWALQCSVKKRKRELSSSCAQRIWWLFWIRHEHESAVLYHH